MAYEQQQTVSEAGEDRVLAAILEVIEPHNAAIERTGEDTRGVHTPTSEHVPASVARTLGPGDDAAVVSFATAPGAEVIMTTDTMSEDQDFRWRWWNDPSDAARDIGAKAAAQNLSDINAMGGVPRTLLVSLSLPADLPVGWVQDFYRGVISACSEHQPKVGDCLISGGDLGSADKISVSITALGQLPAPTDGREGSPLTRAEARPGDQLAVCGKLGRAAAGLNLLERETAEALDVTEAELPVRAAEEEVLPAARTEDQGAEPEIFEVCRRAQKHPRPPLSAGPAALAAGASAGLDVSDGLLRDATRLARASRVQITLDDDAITREGEALEPIAESLGLPPETAVEWVLSGGEDYALLATFPAGADLPEGFRVIGVLQQAAGSDTNAQLEQYRVISSHAAARSGWD